MTDVIVEVGPGIVRGPNDGQAEWVSAALEYIDDDIALIDDHPVSVADVWREVLRTAAGGSVESIALVCPTWWSSSRIDRVRDAAHTVAMNVVVLQRSLVLREGLPNQLATVVEIAPQFVVISSPDADVAVVTRGDGPAAVAKAVEQEVGASTPVLVDAPAGVEGAVLLGASIADRLRSQQVAVAIPDARWVRREAVTWLAHQRPQTPDPDGVSGLPPADRSRRGRAVLAGALLSAAALCGGFAVRDGPSGPPSEDIPVTLLVEGRVGVKVPAQWEVQRITSGPGSARVQIVSPSDADIVVHITQSSIPSQQTLATAADGLRKALADQPEGVFVDFNPDDRRGDKPAVTYREVRADHQVAWMVLIDHDVRIAIGCQSAPGREQFVRDACGEAVRSVHAVF
jgi:type VII secretion-associated protein (TIGR03931 family)